MITSTTTTTDYSNNTFFNRSAHPSNAQQYFRMNLLDWSSRIDELAEIVINDLNEFGMSVIDDFLGAEEGLKVLNEAQRMNGLGVFQNGQLVNDLMDKQDTQKIRGDKLTWVQGVEEGCLSVGHLLKQIDKVIYKANIMHNNGLLGNYNIKGRTKAMVACYPGGGTHYVMHVDNANKDGRVITATYYLNLNWDVEQSGGVLRIFPDLPDQDHNIDIAPNFDRIIFFWSDKRTPHAVKPAHRTRYAITVWYYDAEEREAALQRAKYKNSMRAAPPTIMAPLSLPPSQFTPAPTSSTTTTTSTAEITTNTVDVLAAGAAANNTSTNSNNILTNSNSSSNNSMEISNSYLNSIT